MDRKLPRSKNGSPPKKGRHGVPIAAIGRKILPAEMVTEKLAKKHPSSAAAPIQPKPAQKAAAAVPAPRQNPGRQPRHAEAKQQLRPKTPVRIIPLGGLGEIGKNMTVIECANDMFIIDCGLAFPDAEMLGVDLVIPDFT
ncbi:MAG: hypothetical protein IK130_08695, partial [Oscillospiraceae bacterium]|nr:hypothetical protein [Oscillospiraceae bacterium]